MREQSVIHAYSLHPQSMVVLYMCCTVEDMASAGKNAQTWSAKNSMQTATASAHPQW